MLASENNGELGMLLQSARQQSSNFLLNPDFQKIFESAPGLYLVLTTDLRIVAVSDSYLRATMTKRCEIIGRELFDVFPDNPNDPEATGTRNLRESLQRVLRQKISDVMAVQKYDVRRPESEGGTFEERFWSPVNSPVLDENGGVCYIIHRVEDVTDFVRLKVLGKEQSKLTEELKSRAAKMESEIYLRAQELQETNKKLRAANEELDRRKVELESRVKESTADLSRTNESLKKSEQQYRLLFENNPNPMWVFDSQTLCFLAVNEAAINLYGYSREEFLGMTLRDVRLSEEVDGLQPTINKSNAGVDAPGNWKHRKKDGTIIDVEVSMHDLDYGARKAKVVLVHDVTERKKLETQVLRNQRMESIGTLAGGIAHDLNNVLAPILLSLQVLRKHNRSESDQRILETLERSAQRGAGMVKQVLAFARGVDGERSLLQVRHLIDETEKIIKDTFDRSIQIYTNVPKDLWTISADPTQMYQVLMNLCVNARDAMPNGGRLRIEAANVTLDEQYAKMHLEAKPGPYVVLTVVDTGTGIPASVMDKIFEPFFTTKELGKGTGLGLSTVVGIVKGHGGFVNVYSEVGKGTEFRIYVPAVDTNVNQVERNKPRELPSGKGELILVVDDEMAIRDIAKSTLENYGYRVELASDGTQAIAAYAMHGDEIHVVVTDMMMPFMDGPATIRALRNMNPRLKIIAMSGLMDNQKVAEVAEHKYVTFLQKPFTSERFLISLAELINVD